MLDTLRQSGRLMLSRRMLVFSATLAYSGLHLSLWSGVFATAVGFTAGFGENRKSFATLCCVLISIGEVSGGVLFGLLGHLTVRRGRHPVLLLGATVSITAYRHLLHPNIVRQLLLVLGFKF